jgi:hypothetical protein
MSKLRLILLLTVVLVLATGMNAMAASKLGTESAPVLQQAATPEASAVFAALMASLPAANIDTLISVSNTMGVPDFVDPVGEDTQGTIEFFLWNQDGTLITYDTAQNPDLGSGLNADGTLGPGQTYTVFLREILAELGFEEDEFFTGYAWVIGNFDAVAGTYNIQLLGPELGFTQAFIFEPNVGLSIGVFGTFGGVPLVP